jgi:hypothetical protein
MLAMCRNVYMEYEHSPKAREFAVASHEDHTLILPSSTYTAVPAAVTRAPMILGTANQYLISLTLDLSQLSATPSVGSLTGR